MHNHSASISFEKVKIFLARSAFKHLVASIATKNKWVFAETCKFLQFIVGGQNELTLVTLSPNRVKFHKSRKKTLLVQIEIASLWHSW